MRDLVFLAVFCGVLPFALRHAWIGVLMWCWVSLMNPHKLTWSLAAMPAAQIVAIVTVVAFFFFHDNTRRPPLGMPTWLVVALWAWAGLAAHMALDPVAAWPFFEHLSKMLLFVLLSLFLFQDLRRLRWLLWVLVGSIAFYGVKGAIFSIVNGGQDIVFGPPGSYFEDNNNLALALNMALPLTVFFARSASDRRASLLWWGVAGSTVLSILFTYSRGGVLALGVTLMVTLLRSRQRVPAMAVAVLVLVAALVFAPAKWQDRVNSIGNYAEDSSVNDRFNAWHFSWNVAREHPILGGGFGVFTPDNFTRWAPDPGSVFVAHSIYFDLMATMGFPGLALYLMLLGTVMWRAGRLRRVAHAQGATWFSGCAEAIQLATVAFAVGGAFLSQTWHDLFFHLVAVLVLAEALAGPIAENPKPHAQLASWRREVDVCAA